MAKKPKQQREINSALQKVATIQKNILAFIKNNRIFLISFGASLFVFLLWLTAFYPGNMSPDSIAQWKQISTNQYDNAHPFFHTLILKMLRIIYDSPASVTFFQCLVSTFLLSYTTQFFSRMKVNKLIIYIAWGIFVLSPSIEIYNVTLWKDVLFAQSIYGLGLLWLVHSSRKKELTWKSLLLIAICTVIAASLRHNGVIYMAFIPFLYLVSKTISLKKSLLLGLCLLTLYLIINVGLLKIFHVTSKYENLMKESFKVAMLGGVIRNNGEITPEEKSIIEEVMSLDEFNNRYNCSAIDYFYLNNSPFNKERFRDDDFAKKFDNAANSIILRNLPDAISDRTCLFVHQIGLGDQRWAYIYINYVIPNDLNISQDGIYILTQNFSKYLTWTSEYPQFFLFWSHGIYILIFLAFTLKSIYDRNKVLFGFIAIVLINLPFLFIFNGARDFRYLFMIPFALPFLLPISRLKQKE